MLSRKTLWGPIVGLPIIVAWAVAAGIAGCAHNQPVREVAAESPVALTDHAGRPWAPPQPGVRTRGADIRALIREALPQINDDFVPILSRTLASGRIPRKQVLIGSVYVPGFEACNADQLSYKLDCITYATWSAPRPLLELTSLEVQGALPPGFVFHKSRPEGAAVPVDAHYVSPLRWLGPHRTFVSLSVFSNGGATKRGVVEWWYYAEITIGREVRPTVRRFPRI